MSNKKSAPSKTGAEYETLSKLWNRKGYTARTIAPALGVDPEIALDWAAGIGVPDAKECVLMSDLLGCSLTEVYLAILNT